MRSDVRRSRWSVAVAVFAVAALVVSACGNDNGDDDETSVPVSSVLDGDSGDSGSSSGGSVGTGDGESTPVPTASPAQLGPPYTAELPWGDFALAERITAKLADGAQLNFVLSVAATGVGGSGEVMGDAWSTAAGEFDAAINPRVIGPNSADRSAQVETIDSLINSGSIDCLAVEADDSDAFVGIINQAVEAGIPTFTMAGDNADSKRFAFYGIDDRAAGKLVGTMAGEWAVENRILMRKAGVLTGNVDDPRYRARIQGFIEGLLGVHSGIEFVNGPETDVVSQGFDPETVYTAAEAWVLARPDVDMIFHTDAGMAQVARVIADQSLYGDVYTSGFHIDEQMANFIRDGVVVVAAAQGLFNQASSAATACGEFLLNGDYEVGLVVQEPLTATRGNVEVIDWSSPQNQ